MGLFRLLPRFFLFVISVYFFFVSILLPVLRALGPLFCCCSIHWHVAVAVVVASNCKVVSPVIVVRLVVDIVVVPASVVIFALASPLT